MKFVSILAVSTLTFTLSAFGQNQTHWTASTSSLNWSDTANWDSGVPTSIEMTYFDDFYYGYTNVPGLVNNVVDSSCTVGGLTYNAFGVTNTFNGMPADYHTTLIPAGVALGVAGIDGMPGVRVGLDLASYNNGTVVATIMGPGSLFVTNSNSTISIFQGSSSSGTHKATLDLSALGALTVSASNVLVGVSSTIDKASGSLLLPPNSVITTAPNPNAPGILLGRGMTNNGFGNITLGATTTFNTDGLVVGGSHSSFGVNLLNFQVPAFGVTPASTFTLRGSAGGSSPASVFAIGDNSATETNYLGIANNNGAGSSSSNPSTADFTAGAVDLLTTNLFVGRSAADNPLVPSGTSSGTGFGNLAFNNGTINALAAWIGFKQGTNRSAAVGTITARGNAVLIVSNDLTLAQVTNTVTGVTATLNVNDNATVNVGGNMLTKGGTSTLNLAGGTVNMTGGGNVSANTLSGFGTINNAGTVVVSNTVTLGIANANGVQPGTLNIGGNVTLPTGVVTKFKLGSSTVIGSGVNDYLNVTGNLTLNNNNLDLGFAGAPVTGTYDLVDYSGTKAGSFNFAFINTTRNTTFTLDQTTANHVRVMVAGGPPASLTWKGGANGIWDLTNNINWNNNTDKFYTLDNVIFDDTGVQSIIQIPSAATVLPSSITFNNNSKTYTLYAPGKITGCASVTKNGNGMVIWDTQGANDFTGPVNINQGTIQIQSVSGTANFFGTTNKMITIASGATLDIYGNTTGGSGVGWPITFSGTGVNGIGAISHTKASSGPTLFTPKATLAGDASVGAITSGVNLFVAGITTLPLGGTLDLAGHTLTTIGGGNVGLVNLIATNSGDIHVASANFILRDVIVDGSGTITAGNSTISLGNLNGTAWTTGYVAKAISMGPGLLVAPGSNNVVIPVSSPISLSGTLTVSNAQWVRLSGVISGNNGLTKIGPGRTTLAGANTYAGSTIVSGGTLALDTAGSVANSQLVQVGSGATLDVTAQPGGYTVPFGQTLQVDSFLTGNVTVPAGATLAGSGTNFGTVVVNGGAITPGRLDVAGTLTVGNLSLSNASFAFELDAPTTVGGNVNDLVVVNQLTVPGTNIIKIVPLGSLNNVGGQYTLFTYGGATLPSSVTNNFVLTSDTRYTFSFVDPATTPGALEITVTGGRDGLVWQGGVTGAETAWNINFTPNWNNGGNPDTFFNGDSVTFDDTATTNRADLLGGLRPAAINLVNNTLSYTFAGTGTLRVGAITNNGTAGLTLANSSDNLVSGAGLFLNAGSVNFNQPVDATFTGTLNGFGGGALNKNGANRLTLTGNNAATYYGPVNVNSGTLRAGATNALGAGQVSVADGATLDLNGQALDAATMTVSGTGVGGLGAIVNTGSQQTNALSMVALAGDTTLNSSNRWDVRPSAPFAFRGNNFAVTKIGPGDVWVDVGSDTGLGDLDIQQGRFVFAWNGTDVGNPTNVITVHSNASLAFGMDIKASSKSVAVLPGGDLEAFAYTGVSPSIGRSNLFAGNVTFGDKGLVRVANLAGLELAGTVQGPAGIVNADRGTLTLSGSNSYAGDLTVNLGQVNIGSSNALPPGTTVTLNCTGIPSSDIVLAGLVSDTVTPASVPLNMISYRSPSGNLTPQLTGEGTWQGPIVMNAVQTDPSQNPQFTFAASSNLVIGGSVTQTGSPLAVVNINGFPGTVRFMSPLVYNGTMTMGSQGLGVDDLSQKYTTMELDAAGNSFTNMNFWRGKIIVGVDNAIPVNCPMTIPAVRTDNDARNIIDLHGHSQVFSNFPGAAGFAGSGAAPLWIGSDNTNADSTVVFTSPLTNTWYAWLLDNIDTNIVTTRHTGLNVTSGNLRLANLVWANWTYGGPAGATTNTYSGPTLVTGGTLQVDTPILNSTVTVSGTGRLAGSGPIYTPITVGAGATLSPGGTATTGSAIGIMTNYNNLTLLPGSKCVFEVNLGTRTNDSVFGSANVSLGGTLVITNIGAQVFTNGTVLKLFNVTNITAGAFSLQPMVPAANLIWDASQLAVNGTLRVTTPTPTGISGVGHMNDGNVGFTITGVVGQAYSIRGSNDPSAPVASWPVLERGTLPSANYTFTDLTATNFPARFYIISTP